jgi:hypothetical protein
VRRADCDLDPVLRPSGLEGLPASRITGSGYWDDEMIEQARFMRQRPLAQRLDFYRAIVLLGDLDTYRGSALRRGGGSRGKRIK